MKKEKSYPLLLQWMRKQEIKDTMRWKDAAISQKVFVRDTLCGDLLHTPVFVVSTHTSKSIKLPVYRFRIHNGIIVTARDNFSGWVVSIKSPFAVNLPKDLVSGWGRNYEDMKPCYCEGFKEDWVYPCVTENVRLSTFCVDSNYALWTLMRELNQYEPVEKEQRTYSVDIIAMCIGQAMTTFDDMKLYEVFPCYHRCAYNYDFCKAHELDCYFYADKESDKDELTQEIEDFAKRLEMTPEFQQQFNNDMSAIWMGRIEENGLEMEELNS